MIYSKGKTLVEPASDSLLAFFPVGEISARAEPSKRLWLNDYGIHLSVSKALDLDLPSLFNDVVHVFSIEKRSSVTITLQ
jgi:hypothetical protein